MLVKHIPPGERLLLLGDLRSGIEPRYGQLWSARVMEAVALAIGARRTAPVPVGGVNRRGAPRLTSDTTNAWSLTLFGLRLPRAQSPFHGIS
jgi:hypothetical protein